MLGLVLGVVLAAPSSPTPRPPAEISLRWDAPDGCPSGDEIRARYRRLVSQPLAGAGVMDVVGRVEKSGDTWRLALTTTFGGVSDARSLDAVSCDELGDAAAMVLAVALEPGLFGSSDLAVEDPPSEEAVLVPPSPVPTGPTSGGPTLPTAGGPTGPTLSVRARPPTPDGDPSPPPPYAKPRRPISGLLRPVVGLEYGALPGVTAMLGLAGGLLWPRARLEIEAAWLTPRTAAGPRGSKAATQTLLGSAHACLRSRVRAFEFPTCAGLEAGLVVATSTDVVGSGVITGPWLAPSARAAVVRAWRRFGVFVGVGLAPRVVATRVRIDDAVVFTPKFASFRAIVGLEVYFPPR